MALETELKTYESRKGDLLTLAGKFVLIADQNVVGARDIYEDALRAGYQQFGVDKEFFVKRIERFEDKVRGRASPWPIHLFQNTISL
jgi:hypothetical protein